MLAGIVLAATLSFTVPDRDAQGYPSLDADSVTVYGRKMGYVSYETILSFSVRGMAGQKVTVVFTPPKQTSWPIRFWQYHVTVKDTAGNVSGPSNQVWSWVWQ